MIDRVMATNVKPERLITPGDERLIDVEVVNNGTALVELFTTAQGELGEGFPLIPGAEYRSRCSGRTKLWVLGSTEAPIEVSVSRVVVERVPKRWQWKGPVDDFKVARLPFYEAQEQLRGPADPKTAVLSNVEWHGSSVEYGDPETASFALVNENGPLAALVGDRVQVSFGGRQVFAYVHRSAALDGAAISVTRRLFMALAPLDTTMLAASVAVVG